MRLRHLILCTSSSTSLVACLPRNLRDISRPRADQHVLGPDHVDTNLSPYDSRQARGFVAFGDSYSAGIGTGIDGKELTEEGDCRHGVHAYPALIHADLNNRTHSNTSFQWLACTGAVTADLLSHGTDPGGQVDALNLSLPVDFATLSIGGNDLGFFDVMNACIFRFYSFYSGTCEAALAAADDAVGSHEFEHRLEIILHEILDKVAWEKKAAFSITVTGYARFFNADTPECDDMSLGVWWGGPKLSQDIRYRMNELVNATNTKLKRTIGGVNSRFARPRVLFVDYDAQFEGHRFCEPGVVEPAYNRTDTWFFLVGGPDNARNETTWPNGTNGDPDETGHLRETPLLSPLSSPLVDHETCLVDTQRRGDWGELALCYMAIAKHRDLSLRPAHDGGVTAPNGMWWVPTSYGKTFHPRTLGLEVIRDRVYEVWREHGLAGVIFAQR